MSAIWGRYLKPFLIKLFWFFAALLFSAPAWAQVQDGVWSVKVIRSPMGDRSFAVASSDAVEKFNGARPRLVIACEVARDGVSHGLNVFVDLGAPLMLAEHFKDRTRDVPISFKIDDGVHVNDRWQQSETFRELFHIANSEAEQRAFVKWLADSKRLMVELSVSTSDTKVFGFTTTGLKPYVPVMAQACGWHK